MTSTQTRWAEQEEVLSRLTGARLTSVQFVLDYVILGFDERGALTCLVWPDLFDGSRPVSFGMPGYRDMLCSLIEQHANSVTMEPEETISIDFANGIEMRIPLKSHDGHGERAILTGANHYLFVF